jgi:hypothetical protein
LRGELRRKYLKTGMFTRKNQKTKELFFEISAFRRVLPVFFGRNLCWNPPGMPLISGLGSLVSGGDHRSELRDRKTALSERSGFCD